MPPTVLMQALENVRRKVRLYSVLFGVGIVISAAAGMLLATVLLDYLLNLPTAPRLIVMAGALVGIGYAIARWVARPALAKLGLSDVAGRLEHAYPAFDDRLRSMVDFATKQTPGSDMMKDRVISQATALAHRYDLTKAIETRPVWYSAGVAAGSILLIVLLGALAGHEYLQPAFERLLMPFGSHPWPKRVEIQMVSDLPRRIPVGQRVDVRMRLAKGDRASRDALVYYQYGNGRVEIEKMTRGADGIYSASLDARADDAGGDGTMQVWMEAGDDATDHTNITVVQRLAITRAELEITPPPYVNEAPATSELGAVPATATYGSALALKVYFNKELDPHQPVSITPGIKVTAMPQVTWAVPAGSSVVGNWVARESSTFQIHAVDADGFANTEMTDYQVIVRPDQMPAVQITAPAHNEECTPVAVLPLRGVADDDFGIQSMKLLITRLGEKPVDLPAVELVKNGAAVNGATWTRLDSSGERRRWQIDYPWDLSKVDATALKPGDVIEYRLQVRDNFAFEGKYHDPVESGKLRVTILSQEQFSNLMSTLMDQARDQIIEIRNSQRSLKNQTNDLRNDTQKQTEFNKADREQAQQLIARQATAAAQTKQVAGKLDELRQRMEENKSTAQDLKDISNSVKDDLNQASEHPMKEATAQIDDAKNQKTDAKADPAKQQQASDQRNQELDKAQDNQQQAADTLDKAAEKLGEVGGLSKSIQQLKDLLDQQKKISAKSNDIGLKNLGKSPEKMDPQDRKEQQKNSEEQDKLSDKTQQAIDQMMQQSDKMQKSDPSASKAMKQAAQTGQNQNVPAQMKNSAKQQQQNQQAAAQQSQAQVEIGLQMMIRELEEAQNRKLAEIVAQLADVKEQIQALLRQQAGLNYDNNALRGDEALKKLDAALVEKLLAEAERTKDHLPPTPDLGTQTRLQEQTEHNTRSVAKASQALPDGASVEAELSRAAERMGRAITFLREDSGAEGQRLASAYEPPQVDALTALEKASKTVADALKKAQDQQNQQKKDAIRAAYEKILQAQKKLDADTKGLDQTARGGNGQLGHADALRLGQLPGDQGALADKTAKLDDDLAAVGSIVYVWANKDIVDTMTGVKLALAKPDTGVVAQTEQTRIEEQLQAMIESLKTNPKKEEFAKPHEPPKGGGGAGGQPPPQLPAEAELRLLKSLQMAVNKSTTVLDAQAQKDQPTITKLGGRQGELRNLLDQLLRKASHNKVNLGPEPDPKDKLPEEATTGDIDQQELEQQLLNGDAKPEADQIKNDAGLIGQRMGRSHQRLANDTDPGKVTQEIQKRILMNMDALIEMARSQQSQSQPKPGSGQPGEAQPGDAEANNSQPGNSKQGKQGQKPMGGSNPAQQSTNSADRDTSGTPTADITETAREWGKISPRNRAPLIEAASEKPIDKFKTFIDDYYRALGTKATEQGN